MDMIERYLAAVAAQLPQNQREDITAELRDLILSRFEAREEELGRALSDDEKEAILREIGHPLVVAARYRKGPDALVGPELFPYWLFGVKAALLLMAAVQLVVLALHLISGPADAGQAIAQAFHGFFGSALSLIGLLTVIAAVMEHQGIRPRWLTEWRVKDLGAFEMADPAKWGAAMGSGAGAAPKAASAPSWTGGRPARAWPGSEYLFSFLAVGVFVLWWVGLLHFPGLVAIELRGEDAVVTGAPIWAALYMPILAYCLVQMAVDLNSMFRPDAVRLRAAAQIAIAVAGLWLNWTIFQAGHWFDLTRGAEVARIAGDWTMLNLDALRDMADDDRRDLVGIASTLSVVFCWGLAISTLGLVLGMLRDLGRLVRG